MKNKKYDIDSVRVYQSVQFEKKQFTFFSTREINNTPGVEIEIIYDLQSISVKSKDDHIIIPLTNISCVYLKIADFPDFERWKMTFLKPQYNEQSA